jgi:hypothetical protein
MRKAVLIERELHCYTHLYGDFPAPENACHFEELFLAVPRM